MFASYEAARIYNDFCPPINPQALKQALLKPEERDKVAEMMRHHRMPDGRLNTLRESAENAYVPPRRATCAWPWCASSATTSGIIATLTTRT